MEKPYILVESRFSESLEAMVAENMAKGYAVSGGISTSYNGENVWYVQAMVSHLVAKKLKEELEYQSLNRKMPAHTVKKFETNGIFTINDLTAFRMDELIAKCSLNPVDIGNTEYFLSLFSLNLRKE